MSRDIVITEKSSQARDVRAALGNRYGPILPAEGHLIALREPEEVNPDWKRWRPVLLRPEGLFGTKPATGGNKASKLKAIKEALRSARRVWLATDCDRQGQLIGQEILEHFRFRGEVMRVMFTAQDPQTIRDAFARAKPNADYENLYAAAVARQQSDQIYNLSLTRTATVLLGRGARTVIGVGRVKTPTLAIVCRRELTDGAEALVEKAPIDLVGQSHQRVAYVDDLLQRRTEQVLATVVARLAHRSSPCPQPRLQRITIRLCRESQIARNRRPTRTFLQNRLLPQRAVPPTSAAFRILHGRLKSDLQRGSQSGIEYCQRTYGEMLTELSIRGLYKSTPSLSLDFIRSAVPLYGEAVPGGSRRPRRVGANRGKCGSVRCSHFIHAGAYQPGT